MIGENMLGICKIFFDELEKKNILYVHWKSNASLINDLHGESDLDLLFSPEDKKILEEVLGNLNIKKFEAINELAYDGIEDYIGYDEKTNIIIHFHIHFKLIIGQKHLKEYHLLWEERIINSRIKHPETDIWIINHEFELLLLIIRESLRISLLKTFKLTEFYHSERAILEFDWLKSKYNKDNFGKLVRELIRDKSTVNTINRMIVEGLKEQLTISLRPRFQKIFRFNLRFSQMELTLLKTERVFKKLVYALLSRIFNFTRAKRINPRIGAVVALVGCDGSGKSTMVSELKKFYGKKITLKTIYFGQFKTTNKAFGFLLKLLFKLKFKPIINLAYKRKQSRKIQEYSRKGYLVICDRFPQNQFGMIMDGPMLNEKYNSINPFTRFFARKENYFYENLAKLPLKIVFKLLIDEKTAVEREAISHDLAREKVRITRDLNFESQVKVVKIDHTLQNYSIHDVKHIMTSEIWKIL